MLFFVVIHFCGGAICGTHVAGIIPNAVFITAGLAGQVQSPKDEILTLGTALEHLTHGRPLINTLDGKEILIKHGIVPKEQAHVVFLTAINFNI